MSHVIRSRKLNDTTYMHVMEAVVDLGEFPVVGDIFVDLDFSVKVI